MRTAVRAVLSLECRAAGFVYLGASGNVAAGPTITTPATLFPIVHARSFSRPSGAASTRDG